MMNQEPVRTPEEEIEAADAPVDMPLNAPVQQPVQQAKQEDDDDDRRDPFKESKFSKLKRFVRECKRVLKVLRKPGKDEFLTTAKVSALGLAIIGFIGFALSMIQQLVLR